MFTRSIQTWLSYFSLLAFLLSGLSANATMLEMSFMPAHSSQQQLESSTLSHHSMADCHSSLFKGFDNRLGDSSTSHTMPNSPQCCGAACVVPPLTITTALHVTELASTRSVLHLEQQHAPSIITDSLYRPPIL
ncbi:MULTISPECIES: hypothetical protein [unclassified Agarivorans]|uniref:hypothetical protein n=1 Tax=unclassified Agarivorans TaxID=2636026 RepID=UPI0026E48FB9|nr:MULTISPECIES: hypothetical protein [unclassified Agarivorans]MDO6686336.1 hypothetical protein [Agarivorans sp. 3_MG-2023]MDO6713638.1 hypothetical protein [Agarivorans sp. 2_MG-2023]